MHDWPTLAGHRRVPFPDHGEQHGGGKEGKHQGARAHVDIMPDDALSGNRALGSAHQLGSSSPIMHSRTEPKVRKASASDLAVGLICADRDGNRIRIDRVDRTAGTVFYHFLNDELRVQEGVQQRSIEQFLAGGWYIAAPGTSL